MEKKSEKSTSPSKKKDFNAICEGSNENFHSFGNVSKEKSLKLESTLNRLSEFNTKKNNKLDTLRKEQLISEIRSLQDRPNISENSKKIFKNYVPIYKRLNTVVKEKNEYLKSLQLESKLAQRSQFKSACTFKPNVSTNTSRTPEEFTEYAYNWKFKIDKAIELKVLEKDEKIESNVQKKPKISKNSTILTVNRSLTPVFERLYEVRDSKDREENEFRPQITQESKRIIEGKRDQPIFERLYSLRKLQVCKESPKEKKVKKEKKVDLKSDGKYKINSNDGAIFEFPVTLVHSKSNATFLVQDLFNNR